MSRLLAAVLGRTDHFRAWVTSAVTTVLAVAVVVSVPSLTSSFSSGDWRGSVTTVVIIYPVYCALYVTWGIMSYVSKDADRLREIGVQEQRASTRWWNRIAGMSGTANITITAAITAVVVTVIIAQTPEFRGQSAYLVLGLLTVASSWVLVVYSFAQSYMRIAAQDGKETAIRFPFSEDPQFGDYVTLAVLVSTMAATVSAEFTSRAGWRLVRANVVVAFSFNSVIIAMMVSLLFGGLGS